MSAAYHSSLRSDKSDYVGFIDLLRFFVKRWHILLLLAGLCSLASVAYFLTAAKPYEASVSIMQPTQGQGNAGLGANMARLLSIGGNQNTDFSTFMASIDSAELAKRLMKQKWVAEGVFSSQWDEVAQEWRPVAGFRSAISRHLRSAFGYVPWREPNFLDLKSYISAKIVTEEKAGNWLITFRHSDQEFAYKFLSTLLDTLDGQLKEAKLQRLERANSLLRTNLAGEQNLALRTSILEGISANESEIISIRSSDYFSFILLDPVYVSSEPVYPQPALAIIVSLLTGIAGALVIIGFYSSAVLIYRLATESTPQAS